MQRSNGSKRESLKAARLSEPKSSRAVTKSDRNSKTPFTAGQDAKSNGILEAKATGANAKTAKNPKLSKYQELTTQHLDKLNTELGLQLRDLQASLKKTRASNNESRQKLEKLKAECTSEEKKYSTQKARANELKRKRNALQEEITKAKEGIKNFELELKNAEKQESEAQLSLNIVNSDLQNVFGPSKSRQDEVDLVPAKSDNTEISALKKERQQQDSNVSKLRGVIDKAKENIAKVEEKIEARKRELLQKKAHLKMLKDKLKNAEEKKLSLAEECNKLAKLLGDQRDKVARLSDNLGNEIKAKKALVAEAADLKQNSKTVSEETQSFEESILNVERIKNEKKERLEELEAAIQQTVDDLEKREKELAETGNSIKNTQMETEKLRKQYAALYQAKIAKEENEFNAQLAESKKRITEQQRRQVALRLKIEKLEKECETRKSKLNEVESNVVPLRKNLDALQMELKNAQKEVKEAAKNSEVLRTVTTVDGKIEKLRDRLETLNRENRLNQEKLEEKKKEVEELKAALKAKNARRTASQEKTGSTPENELWRLQSQYSKLQKKIREGQRELELCAVRRDNVVDKAEATIPTMYHVRSQALDHINKAQKRVKELKQEIAKTTKECESSVRSRHANL